MASTPVQKELGKIAADFRRFKILRGLAICWSVLAAVGVGLLLLHWATGLIVPFAVPGLLGLAVIAGFVVYLRNQRMAVALRQIARQVESDDPKLNSLLLAASEQEPDRESGQL